VRLWCRVNSHFLLSAFNACYLIYKFGHCWLHRLTITPDVHSFVMCWSWTIGLIQAVASFVDSQRLLWFLRRFISYEEACTFLYFMENTNFRLFNWPGNYILVFHAVVINIFFQCSILVFNSTFGSSVEINQEWRFVIVTVLIFLGYSLTTLTECQVELSYIIQRSLQLWYLRSLFDIIIIMSFFNVTN